MSVEDEFVMQEQVGTGAFSKVHKGRRISDGHVVAIKKIDKAKVKNLSEIADEVSVLKMYVPSYCILWLSACCSHVVARVSHPNVIEFLAFFDAPQFSYVVTEL